MAAILLVDDDGAYRSAVMRALRSAGHEVDEAVSGTAALKILRSNPPDLLMTDIIMNNGDGIELINAVRREFPSMRILAMSGRGSMGALDLLKLAGMLGADAALAKPFDVEVMLEQVATLCAADAREQSA